MGPIALYEIRRRLQISQADAARYINAPIGHIIDFETGKRDLSLDAQKTLLDQFEKILEQKQSQLEDLIKVVEKHKSCLSLKS